eukprot:TRINITY_DN1229_c0_g1_i4.p1 TRINITY_DN1229_c0_g1~~TRINITY_DN1229_c0_g1_i4.p1  ORF type:complete len:445 (+),score=86.06 TRINITY_DN1229_c0_g1_i4:1497-2831(+)
MFKKINYTAAVLALLFGTAAKAQVTTQSPYSKFGLGNVKPLVLPQFRAMGGVSTAIFSPTGYSNINMQNPASYAGITLTTADIGASGTIMNLKKDDVSERSFNGSLNHVTLAFPVSRGSALSVGVLPYTELGYEFKNRATLGSAAGSSPEQIDYLYSGEGGLNKAYLGYGFQIGDHFRLGANAEYIFGNLLQTGSSELVKQTDELGNPNVVNARVQSKNSIGGVAFSYGTQYNIPFNSKTSFTIGYSGTAGSSINSKRSIVASQYTKNPTTGDETPYLDQLSNTEGSSLKMKMPMTHNFGVSLQKYNVWVIGADYRRGKWSDLSIGDVNQQLQDTYGFSAGGQITPDITSIGSYWNRVDYRVGFSYDKTYVQLNDQDIKQSAISFGFGFPLAPSPARRSFYKINFTTEIGKRGAITNSLIQENFINFHLGFTLNDRWFQRFKFD